jgi:hypothetical protein
MVPANGARAEAGRVGLQFNPAPGWPVPYGFVPPPGWEPDPDWPPAPPGWPLWIGSDEPRAAAQGGASGGYVPGYRRDSQAGSPPAWPAAGPAPAPQPGYYVPGHAFRPPVQTSRRSRTVRSLVAVAAFVALAVAGGIVKAVVGAADRSSATGRIVKKGHLDVFSLRTGDCFQSLPFSALGRGVAGVKAVPCRSVHNAQVFAQFKAADAGNYPGRKNLVTQASHGCGKRLGVIDKPKAPPTVRVGFIYPDSVAWFDGHRTISCILRNTSRDLHTSLLRPGRG